MGQAWSMGGCLKKGAGTPLRTMKVILIDLSCLQFNNEPGVQERKQVKDQQSCISIFIAYPTSSNQEHQPDMTTGFHTWPYGRFIETQSNLRRNKLHRTNQGSNFLGGSFSNRDNVRTPIQFRRESQSHHPKRLFFLKNRPIRFNINSTSVIKHVKRKQLSFFIIEITQPLPGPVHSVSRSNSSQFQQLPQVRCSHLEQRIVSSAQIPILQITS